MKKYRITQYPNAWAGSALFQIEVEGIFGWKSIEDRSDGDARLPMQFKTVQAAEEYIDWLSAGKPKKYPKPTDENFKVVIKEVEK